MHYSEQHLATLEIQELEAELRRHNALYWDQNAPEISDYDYDRLVEALRHKAPDSAVLRAMGPSLKGRYGETVEHAVPMLSLDKCYSDEELGAWAKKFEGDVVATPKMDGIAASLRYDAQGRLTLAATRGSGSAGEDITENVHTIKDIPKHGAANLEVRGEIYMRLSVFRSFGDQFSNPRNLAAGAIKSKDPERCRQYELSFAAYDLLNHPYETEVEKFEYLQSLGFPPITFELLRSEQAAEGYQLLARRRSELDFEIDGVVFKANDRGEQERLGATSHHPRFAMAYKFQGDSGISVVEDVRWSVARSGAITPVAIISGVELSGATVRRASLHHAGFIQKLDLSLGAEVMVTRRGGVIPNIERVTKAGHETVTLPTRCPSCQAEVDARGDFLYCSNKAACPDAIIGTIAYFAKVIDIQGFGSKLLTEAYRSGVLSGPKDLFTLTLADLLSLERVGKRLAQRLLREVESHREVPLHVFLRALGIEELGRHVSAILAERYQTLDAILEVRAAELAEIHGIGEIIAEKVVRGLREERSLVEGLRMEMRILDAPAAKPASEGGVLAGKSVVFTGKLTQNDRKTAQSLVRAAGGLTPSGVSKTLDYLVIGDGKENKKSSKQIKAEKIIEAGSALKILSETEFLALLAESPTQ